MHFEGNLIRAASILHNLMGLDFAHCHNSQFAVTIVYRGILAPGVDCMRGVDYFVDFMLNLVESL